MALTLVDTKYDGANRVFTLRDGNTQYQIFEPMSGWTGRPQPYTVKSAAQPYTTHVLPEHLTRALNLGA